MNNFALDFANKREERSVEYIRIGSSEDIKVLRVSDFQTQCIWRLKKSNLAVSQVY